MAGDIRPTAAELGGSMAGDIRSTAVDAGQASTIAPEEQQPRPKLWVERPLEPVVARGCGMHVLGFVPRTGFMPTQAVRASPATQVRVSLSTVEVSSGPSIDAQEAPEKTVHGPACEKNGRAVRRPIFERGNYNRYYGYRHSDGVNGEQDPRLLRIEEHFGPGVFESKEVLDVGCNSGLVSLAVSRTFGARRVVGMDVDSALIDAAEANRNRLVSRDNQGSIEFRAEDILHSALRRPPSMKPERFDVILCLSVTKWVHFAHGDVGIKNLFKRFMKRLRPGGLLVLEPQEWKSYKKKRFLTSEIREVVRGIELRPEGFGKCLRSLGFKRVGLIEPPEGAPDCFKRTIYAYKKLISEETGLEDDVQEQDVELGQDPESNAGHCKKSKLRPVDVADNEKPKKRVKT